MRGLSTALLVLCAGAPAIAGAADRATASTAAPRQADGPERTVQVTPYLWAAAVDGRISPFRRAPTIGIGKSFAEVMDGLEFGGFVHVWSRRGRAVFSGDVMYVSTREGHTSGPLPPLLVPVPPGTVVEGRVDSRQANATLQAGYRIVGREDFTLDVLAGLRAWRLSNDVTVSAAGLSRSYGEHFDWVDPVVGLRAFRRLGGNWSLQAQLDAGGAGIGSDATWSALATANYVVGEHFSLSAGYKVLDVDYDDGGHVYDARLKGPAFGLTYRF